MTTVVVTILVDELKEAKGAEDSVEVVNNTVEDATTELLLGTVDEENVKEEV